MGCIAKRRNEIELENHGMNQDEVSLAFTLKAVAKYEYLHGLIHRCIATARARLPCIFVLEKQATAIAGG